jgi:phosphate:Na+ symporter
MGNLLNRALGVLAVLAAYPFVTPLVTSVEANPARAIADFHSGFNVTLALIFFPFLSLYARLLERLLPARPIPSAMGAPLFLERVGGGAPVTIALGGATREALRLSEVLEEMIAGLRSALVQPDRRKIEAARELDDRLDHINRAIKENLLAIDPTGLDATANDTLARILTFSINLEQAGDLIDRGLLGIARRRIKRGVAFSDAGIADLVAQVDRLLRTLRTSTAVFLSGDIEAARALTSEKEAFRRLDEDATAAHFDRLRSGNVETVETSALHLDALRDLKRVNSHLIEASAYPILKRRGDLLPSRLKSVE